ncbi:hypothetical protein ACFQ6Q_00670 [Streptomyces sp. NPDC056437]|uniref:hypothetical protein n=1 Tax=Streptomyces sp. NPDC056437 TaxID=3345816 RepID=UPI0036B5041F
MTCCICRRELDADERTHQACRHCTDRVDRDLRAIAGSDGLYARLSGRLMPGSSSGGPSVSGSRTAPIPVRMEPLSLMCRGGVVTILQTWVEDWRSYGHAAPVRGGTLQQQCDAAVQTLRFNLSWASESHPAFEEFGRELGQMRRQCEGVISGEKPPRRVPVACPCGTILRVTLDTTHATCVGCETDYDHAQLLDLPLAQRSAA